MQPAGSLFNYNIWLPWPTSTNKLYVPGRFPGSRRLNPKYEQWRAQAEAAFDKQRDYLPTFYGRVSAVAEFSCSRRTTKAGAVRVNCPDLDNHWKAIGDFLQHMGSIRNDSDIMELNLCWTDAVEDGVIVRLKPYGGVLK